MKRRTLLKTLPMVALSGCQSQPETTTESPTTSTTEITTTYDETTHLQTTNVETSTTTAQAQSTTTLTPTKTTTTTTVTTTHTPTATTSSEPNLPEDYTIQTIPQLSTKSLYQDWKRYTIELKITNNGPYTATLESATVLWRNNNGEVLESRTYDYNLDVPEYSTRTTEPREKDFKPEEHQKISLVEVRTTLRVQT